MIRIEQRSNEWAVVQRGEVVSLHPTREEAERAALWLMERDPPEDDEDPDGRTSIA